MIAALGVAMCISVSPAFADQYHDGMGAFDRGDYAAALNAWLPLAEHGNADAQNVLGGMYLDGHGVTPDFAEAVKWYRMAAEQKNVAAWLNLGDLYRDGHSAPQDYREAA